MKLEKKLALALLNFSPVPAMIETILKDSEYEEEVCFRGVIELKKHDYKEYDFLRLLASSGYKEGLLKACARYLELKKPEAEIFSLLQRVNFHWSLANPVSKSLNFSELSQDKLIMIMDKMYREEVYEAAWPHLKLEGKSEDELWEILRRLSFSWYAKPKIVPLLKSTEHLLAIIVKTSESKLEADLRTTCFKQLNLEEKNDSELLALAQQTDYNQHVSQEVIKHFKSLELIFLVVVACKYYLSVSLAAIEKLSNQDSIMLIARESRYIADVSIAAIAKVSEKHILEIWGWHSHNDKVSQAAISHLDLSQKHEDALIAFIKKDQYGESVCRACKPYLHLRKKTPAELIHLLEKTGFTEGACKLFLPALGLKKMTESEIYSLLKKSYSHPHVANVLLKYVSSEEYVLKFVQEMKHLNATFWVEAFSGLLAKKNDEEIFTILKDLHNEKSACRIAIGFQRNKDYILETIRASGYDEETAKIGLKLLK